MSDFDLNPDGPHSPERTARAANLAADAVRFLNYATRGGETGLEYAGDVYALLGALYTATSRMPQLLGQLAGFLEAEADAGRTADDHGRDPVIQAGMAADQLRSAVTSIEHATRHLRTAQGDISGLYVKEKDDDH